MTQPVQHWTPDTLKVLYDERLKATIDLMNERDRRYGERFSAQQDAIEVAQATNKELRANANEWRDAMNDRERNFVRKGENGWMLGVVTAVMLGVGLFITISNHWK